MPPKRPIGLFDGILSTLTRSPFICPVCRHRKALSVKAYTLRVHQFPVRHRELSKPRTASTIASVTAVNAKKEIPSAFQELYASLKALETEAGVYVNISQLHLALRGVESENPVTRIAVLGLNGQHGARRLTKVLLADPLASEPKWEKQITGTDGDERALLLRYGEQTDIDDRHPLVRTLSIPLPLLHAHKLEILVHTISAATEPINDGAASFLVPSLDIVNSPSGRPATVTYPVHKALMYEEGFKSLTSFAIIDLHADWSQKGQMFKGVIDWSWSISQQSLTKDQPVSPINLAMAEAAIDVFRLSLDKSMEYEHMWFDAGMSGITSWLSEGTEIQMGAVKPAIRRLIHTICKNSADAIEREEAFRLAKEKSETILEATKRIIDQGISIWAENAHTELRDRLNVAFHSESWRKTKWWKLFWRIDDVGYIASDILQRAWLVDAEKEMIWISGRIHQSGLLGPPKLRPTPVPDPNEEEQKLGWTPEPYVEDILPKKLPSDFTEPPPVFQPWPQDIFHARSALSRLTVPPLQAVAQNLLLQTVATNVLTSSLSALLYVSISATSPYEAGAIAAVGLVYSLRRLQKRWEMVRTEWQVQLREDGRRVLRSVEEDAREAVREGGKPEVHEIGVEERRIAREAVAKVRRDLDALQNE